LTYGDGETPVIKMESTFLNWKNFHHFFCRLTKNLVATINIVLLKILPNLLLR